MIKFDIYFVYVGTFKRQVITRRRRRRKKIKDNIKKNKVKEKTNVSLYSIVCNYLN